MSLKLTQYNKVIAAFQEALATILEDFDIKTVLTALQNNAEKMAQYVRLVLTALTTNQELVLAGDVAQANKPSVLEAISTFAASAVEKFIAKDYFKVGTTKGVKIAYVSDNFKDRFLGKVEEGLVAATLRAFKLITGSRDPKIIVDLGDNYQTSLAYMWELMAAQPNGEDGKLLTNGYANIFYIDDVDGNVWAVGVLWVSGGWSVHADSVDDPYGWLAGGLVFGR